MTPDLPADFQELVLKHCDERLTAEEAARLNELLRDRPEVQRQFLRLASIHARLSWEFGPREMPALAIQAALPQPTTRRSRVWAVSAASVAAVACMVAAIMLAPVFLLGPPPLPPGIATLTGGVDAVWEDSARTIGDWLAEGSLRLRSGVAQITFTSGVVAVIEGPADLDLAGDRCYLRQGRLVARVPAEAVGFIVETARLRVLDLGTEFGVSAEDQGESVQVYKGEVLARVKPGAREAQPARPDDRLESGQALSVAAQGEVSTTPFIPDRFVRYLPGPNDPSGRGKHPYNDPENEAGHRELHIYPAPAVTIDGDLSEWDGQGEFRSACVPPYEAYSVAGALKYDDQFLYVGARVQDPFPLRSQVSPHETRELYGHGGCVALRLSTDRKVGWPLKAEHADARNGRPATPHDLSDQLAFVVMWFYEPEQLPCLHLRYGMDFHGAQVNPPGYRGAFRKTARGDGYTVEYAIPWSLLHAAADPPRAGDELACTWLVHWSDAEGKNWQGQLIDVVNPAETGWNFQRAATWGRALYKPRP